MIFFEQGGILSGSATAGRAQRSALVARAGRVHGRGALLRPARIPRIRRPAPVPQSAPVPGLSGRPILRQPHQRLQKPHSRRLPHVTRNLILHHHLLILFIIIKAIFF